MLKDFCPVGMVASLLRPPDGAFTFMQYTTITKVNGLHCEVDVYRNHEFWHTYEFHLDRLFIIHGENILTHISWKVWGSETNIQEIHNSILKHLLFKCHGNG
jgi:hypothetical protein